LVDKGSEKGSEPAIGELVNMGYQLDRLLEAMMITGPRPDSPFTTNPNLLWEGGEANPGLVRVRPGRLRLAVVLTMEP